MGIKLKPKEEKFFRYLQESTQTLKQAANILYESMGDSEISDEMMNQIAAAKQQANEVTNKIIALLKKIFITPIDREDIYLLAQSLVEITDNIKETVECMALYNPGPASEGVRGLAKLIVRAAKQLDKAVELLAELKKQSDKVEERCMRIARIEAEGKRIYRQELVRLFRNCNDPIEIIKYIKF